MTVSIALEGNVSDGARRQILESVQALIEGFADKVRETEKNQRASAKPQAMTIQRADEDRPLRSSRAGFRCALKDRKLVGAWASPAGRCVAEGSLVSTN
jgi:hypothetical protein